MERYLLTVIPGLGESAQEKIREAAESRGFTAMFYETPEEAAEMLPKAEIVFGQSGNLADHAPSLKWLCTPSAGINQFTKKDVFLTGQAVLTNSSGAYGVTIAEHVIMILLEILRRKAEYSEIVARREWIRDLPIRSIRDSRITLVGTGNIGQETAIRLRSFSPECLVGVNRRGANPDNLFDRVVLSENMWEVLPETDVLIISLPGTPDTEGMLGEKELALLPDGTVIINVGRGTIIRQSALEKELRKGRLFAGLDVFEQEPIPAEDSLWTCPNLIITPHCAGNMTLPYTVNCIVEMFLENLDNYCQGRPMKRLANIKNGY